MSRTKLKTLAISLGGGFCLLMMSLLLFACGSADPVSMEIVSGLESRYFVGDEAPNLEEVQLNVTFSDKTTSVVSASNSLVTIEGSVNTQTAGEYEIKFTYTQNKVSVEASKSVTVFRTDANALTISTGIASSQYYGEASLSGLIVTVSFSGTEDTETFEYDADPSNFAVYETIKGVETLVDLTELSVGSHTLTIAYTYAETELKSSAITLEIVNRVCAIQPFSTTEVVNYDDDITAYLENLSYVTAVYLDGTTQTVQATSVTIYQDGNVVETPSEIGTYQITFSYTEESTTTTTTSTTVTTEATLVIDGPIAISGVSGLDELFAGDSIDLKDVEIDIEYCSGKVVQGVSCNSENVTVEFLDGSAVDDVTLEAGTYTIKITYIEGSNITLTLEFSFEVADEEVIQQVVTFSAPSSITEFESIFTSTSDEINYLSTADTTYYVGSNNKFVLTPNVAAYVSDGETSYLTSLEEFYTTITIEILGTDEQQETTYTTLTGEDLAKYVSVDNYLQTYQFTEDAVGEQFRITVALDQTAYPDAYIHDTAKSSFSLVVEIVDAWNVYSVADLSVIHNANTNWDSIKKENGLVDENGDPISNVSSLVFHTDINVTKSDLPEMYFLTDAQLLGYAKAAGGDSVEDYYTLKEAGVDFSLKNNQHIIEHVVTDGESTEIYGNYFTLNLESLPYTVMSQYNTTWNLSGGSHSKFFNFEYSSSNDTYYRQNYAKFSNLTIIGNAEKKAGDDAESIVRSGGICAAETWSVSFKAENVVFTNLYTDVLSSFSGSYTTDDVADYMENIVNEFDYVNAQDSYSTHIYGWGGGQIKVTNSVLQNSGGPAIIIGIPGTDSSNEYLNMLQGSLPWAEIEINNSTVESYVNGTETWFVQNNATSIASNVAALSQLVEGYSAAYASAYANYGMTGVEEKTWVVDKSDDYSYIDLKVLFMYDGSSIDCTLRGKVTIDGVVVTDLNVYADMEYALYLDGGSAGTNVNTLLAEWGDDAETNLASYYYAKVGTTYGAPVLQTSTSFGTDNMLITQGSEGNYAISSLDDATSGVYSYTIDPSISFSSDATVQTALYALQGNAYLKCIAVVLGYYNTSDLSY